MTEAFRRPTHKRKQASPDANMEPQKSGGFFWNRRKQSFSADPNKRRKSSEPVCAHERFLEHEGFLSSEMPARLVKPAHTQTNYSQHNGYAKASEDSGRASPSACQNQRCQSFSSSNVPVIITGTSPPDPPKRSRKSILSFGRSIDGQSHGNMRQRSRLSLLAEQDPAARTPSFLRRCMSIKSQGRPQTPSTPLPPYHESPPQHGHLPAPVPEFGLVPGFGFEPTRPATDLSSGAAARAAAAAQNEILATMRSLSFAEPKITRDSESGVGIEVRDCAEETAGPKVPVVRQGRLSYTVIVSRMAD